MYLTAYIKQLPGLFFLLSLSPALSIQVTGKIVTGGKPVTNALVSFSNEATVNTYTDKKGVFTFKNLEPGKYLMVIESPEYEDYSSTVTVDSVHTVFNVTLENRITKLDEVTVTGTIQEMKVSDSPVKVDIISPKLFQKNPTPNLFQAVGMINGVKPQINCNVCNTGDIHINGMEGPYTMILIDGMPIVSGLSTVYGLMGIPNSIVERIEIMKGPAGALYGSEAMGGIINVITKNTGTAPRFYFDHQASSWQEYNTDIATRLRVSKNVSTLVSTNYFHYNTPYDHNNDGFTDITLQKRISAFNKWNFNLKGKPFFTLAGRYVYEDRWGGQNNWNRSFRGSDSIYAESIFTNRYEVISSMIIPVKEKIVWQNSYNYHNQNSFYGISPYMALQQIGFSQLYWEKKASTRHSFILGASGRLIYYDDNTPVTEVFDSLLNQKLNKPDRRIIPGIFYQHQYMPNEKNTLLLGLRLDHDKTHKYIFSPRFAWKFSPNENNQLRLNAGTGFRVVNLFTEDHQALTGARTVIIKESLNPEQSQNINLTYTKKIARERFYISLDAGAFYTRFSNRIIADYDTDPNMVIYENLKGKAVTQGFNFNLEYSNAMPVKLIAGITFSDVTYDKTNPAGETEKTRVLFAPKWSGNYLASYTLQKINLSFDVTGNWYGPQRLPVFVNDYRPAWSPWFALLNINIKKTFRAFDFYGGIKNVLNFVPKDPIMRPFDPFDKQVNDPVNNPNNYSFDPSYNYASLQGISFYLGIRVSLR